MQEIKTIELGSTVEEVGTEDVGIVYDIVLDGQARTVHYKVLGEFFNPKTLLTADELDVLAPPSPEALAKVEAFLNPTPVVAASFPRRELKLFAAMARVGRSLFFTLKA